MTALLKITQKMTTDNNGGKMAKELLDEKYLENQLREAFTEIAINKKNWKIATLSICIGLVISISAFLQNASCDIESKIVDIFLTTELACFACFYTVFSVVMTFMQGDNLKIFFATVDDKYASMLNKAVLYYESISCLYFIGIATSVIYEIALMLKIVDINACCLSNIDVYVYNILFYLYYVLFAVYSAYSIRIILEIKSIIKNTSIVLRAGLDCKVKKGD